MEHVATTIAHMAIIGAWTEVGHRSPLPDDVPSTVRRAIARIRPAATNVRRVGGGADRATHDVYEDSHGYVYRFDRADERLVAVDRLEDPDTKARQARDAARLPVAQLRDLAVALIATVRPDFVRTRAGYHPLEGNRRRDLYLFRWEDCRGPVAECDDPPFVEVSLHADGTLVRFADTLPH